MELYLDRSCTRDERDADTPEKILGQQRKQQLLRWIKEDWDAQDFLCTRTFLLWRTSVIERLTKQSNGPLVLPRDVLLPQCLAEARGLASQKVRIEPDLSVKILVFGGDMGYVAGMELIPADA